jgi:hypothetical protein
MGAAEDAALLEAARHGDVAAALAALAAGANIDGTGDGQVWTGTMRLAPPPRAAADAACRTRAARAQH